jgi:hypothetical protein
MSNISLLPLRIVYDSVAIEPSIVQHPFSADNHIESDARAFCVGQRIAYQDSPW